MMKHNVTCGNWSRAGTYPGSSAEVSKASSKTSTIPSSKTIKEQIADALNATEFIPRKTYAILAKRFDVKPSAISAVRYKLIKNKI